MLKDEIEGAFVENEGALLLPQQDVCSTNSPPEPLAERYRKARNRLRRLDSVLAGIEAGSRASVALSLKSAVYFAIATIDNPKASRKLEGWGEIDIIDRDNRKYLHPMKYLFRECKAPSLKSKISVWSAIAKDVHTRNILENTFLDVLKKHGGIDRWYRSLPKDPSKGGRPKANKPKPGSVEDIRERRARLEAPAPDTNPKSVYRDFMDTVLEPLKAKNRQVVLIAFDVTQSPLSLAEFVQRFRARDEFAGAMPICGISDEDWRKEMSEADEQSAEPETIETETHDMKEAA